MTRRAHETGYSRTSIYHHAQRVEQAVVNEQLGGINDAALWAANERLRAENAALWEAWAETGSLPEAKQQALAATGSAMGLSLGQIMTLLAIFLPNRAVPSRATVGRWVSQSSRQAGVLLARDQLCQRWVLVLCLDAIFGFDHGVGHPLLILCPTKETNYRKNKALKELAHYSQWPNVADAVIEAQFSSIVSPS